MSLRDLPALAPVQALSNVDWTPPADVLARWHPEQRAAVAQNNEATISIYETIGEDPWSEGGGVTARRIAAILRNIGERPVAVNINSPGGDFFEGVAIYNLLREHKAEVGVNVVGLAGSAASIIAMAGDDIRIGEYAYLFVHNVWGLVIGNRHDMTAAAEMFAKFDKDAAGVYASRSGNDVDTVSKWLDDETLFNGAEAVKLGLADGVLAADAIENDAGAVENSAKNLAVRQVEAALAAQGMSRNERRSLIAAMYDGKPGAAVGSGKPGAAGWTAAAQSFSKTLTKRQT